MSRVPAVVGPRISESGRAVKLCLQELPLQRRGGWYKSETRGLTNALVRIRSQADPCRGLGRRPQEAQRFNELETSAPPPPSAYGPDYAQ